MIHKPARRPSILGRILLGIVGLLLIGFIGIQLIPVKRSNPTVHAFEEKVRALEGAVAATSFATGMAATSNTQSSISWPPSCPRS